MNGLLVVDKPVGPTSHDVVARVRRAFGERRVGHTGTLDPAATGVLPVVIGKATRLARFLTDADKVYEAVIQLGARTDTYDAGGEIVGSVHDGPMPSRDAVDRALDVFRGTFLQQPPAYSAKKIEGRRSYRLARARKRSGGADQSPLQAGVASLPAPVSVSTRTIELLGVSGGAVTIRLECSAGFYVRSLAHDVGERLGVGGHLRALRRVRSGAFAIEHAVALQTVEESPHETALRIIPLSQMLPALTSVFLTPEGVRRAIHGVDLGPEDLLPESNGDALSERPPEAVRLLDAGGELVAVAEPARRPGLLHPLVVLM